LLAGLLGGAIIAILRVGDPKLSNCNCFGPSGMGRIVPNATSDCAI
jgi:hypothetical protein